MAEYIEREELLKNICNACDGWCNNTNCDCVNCKSDHRCEIIIEIADTPAADVVEVVRCKDCTYRADPMECPMCFEEYTDLSEDEWDSIISDSTVDDGFCHHGKRRDGEG